MTACFWDWALEWLHSAALTIKDLNIFKIKKRIWAVPHIGGYIQTEKKAPGKSAFSLCQWHIYLPKIKNCNLLSCPLSALKVKMWKCFKRKYPNIPLQPTRITLAFGMGLPETWKQMRPFSQLWASVGQNQEPRNQSLFIRSTTI